MMMTPTDCVGRKSENIYGMTFVIVGMACLLAACSQLPRTSRSGKVHEIIIGESFPLRNVTVQMGDEVRWLNQRNGSVQIVFLDSLEGRINCRRGFGFSDVVNATSLPSHHSASLCFSQFGLLRYTVRLDRALQTGQMNFVGLVTVEAGVKAWN
jgi:plastocyanin